MSRRQERRSPLGRSLAHTHCARSAVASYRAAVLPRPVRTRSCCTRSCGLCTHRGLPAHGAAPEPTLNTAVLVASREHADGCPPMARHRNPPSRHSLQLRHLSNTYNKS